MSGDAHTLLSHTADPAEPVDTTMTVSPALETVQGLADVVLTAMDMLISLPKDCPDTTDGVMRTCAGSHSVADDESDTTSVPSSPDSGVAAAGVAEAVVRLVGCSSPPSGHTVTTSHTSNSSTARTSSRRRQ